MIICEFCCAAAICTVLKSMIELSLDLAVGFLTAFFFNLGYLPRVFPELSLLAFLSCIYFDTAIVFPFFFFFKSCCTLSSWLSQLVSSVELLMIEVLFVSFIVPRFYSGFGLKRALPFFNLYTLFRRPFRYSLSNSTIIFTPTRTNSTCLSGLPGLFLF